MNTYKYYKGSRQVNTFTINNVTFQVRMREHADIRQQERKIDMYKIIGIVLCLGEKRIHKYHNSGRDIFIKDNDNNISVVLYIKNYTIFIRTVIDTADCYVRNGTSIINL